MKHDEYDGGLSAECLLFGALLGIASWTLLGIVGWALWRLL